MTAEAQPGSAEQPRVTDLPPPALDEHTIEWLTWRCLVLRQASRLPQPTTQLHWARSLPAAVAEARARNVPLVVVLLGWGDEPPPLFRDRGTVELLNEAFVLLLAQKEDREENKKKELHEQLVVDGESRCARNPVVTCKMHDDARRALKDDDRDQALFPGGEVELAKGEDCRLLVHLPGTSTLAGFSDEPERSGLARYDAPAMTKALVDARNALGSPRLPLSALGDLVRADGEAGEGHFKRAIDLVQDALRSEHELVRAFARHELEVGLPARCDTAIAAALTLPRDKAKRALDKLKRELNQLSGCVERVEAALRALPAR